MRASATRAKPGAEPCILMVCPRFLPHLGGVENHVNEIARRINRDGLSVEVLTTDDSGVLPEVEDASGLTIRRVPALRLSGEARLAPGLIRAIRRGRWDIIHLQHFHAGVAPIVLWAANSADIPTVVTFHGGGQRHWFRLRIWPPKPSLLAPFVLDSTRSLLRKAEALIAVAQFEIDDLAQRLKVPKRRFALIPNGCDRPPQIRRDKTRDPLAPHLVSMGRLTPEKGHHRVLEAFPYILADRPRATLWIAGDGPMKQELIDRATSLGVAEHVRIHAIPAGQRQLLLSELANCDVLIAMSDFEAHPLSVIEALSVGLSAVVSEDRAGLSELASRGLVRAVEQSEKPETLAKAVLSQCDTPIAVPPGIFPTWDECATRTRAIYERILCRKQGPAVPCRSTPE